MSYQLLRSKANKLKREWDENLTGFAGRIQRVVIEDAVSVDQEIGLGSVLDPKIYCM